VEQLVAVTAGSDMPFTVHLQAEIPSTHSSTLDGNGEQTPETPPVAHEGATGPGHATTSTAKTIGLVVGGAGVAGIALGTVFGLLASSKWSQAKNDCGHGCPNGSPARSEQNEASTDGTVSTIAFAIGGVALATGFVLYLTAPATRPPEAASTWTLLASGDMSRGEVTLRGTW
jgi:serine/threonine-protein kinase